MAGHNVDGGVEREGTHSLEGRRVLVTGGTAGIGLATCRHLLEAGARVFTFARHPSHVTAGKEYLPEATVGKGDQGSVEDLARLVDEAEVALGGLDAVVVNAGIGASSVTKMRHFDWDEAMQVNLLGPMHLAALAAPKIQAAGGGHIVFLGSMSAKTRSEGGDVYVASKLGLHGFVDSFGRGVAKQNVNACLIEPGLVYTDMTAESNPNKEEKVAKGEMLVADDIARTILFVLSQPPRVSMPLIQVRPRMQLI